MKIMINDQALTWFKDEVGLKKGDMVKFYTKIYGTSPVQEGYALAFTIDKEPINMAIHTEIDGIGFYIEESDLWFFKDHDLHVEYNEKKDEIEFNYMKP